MLTVETIVNTDRAVKMAHFPTMLTSEIIVTIARFTQGAVIAGITVIFINFATARATGMIGTIDFQVD